MKRDLSSYIKANTIPDGYITSGFILDIHNLFMKLPQIKHYSGSEILDDVECGCTLDIDLGALGYRNTNNTQCKYTGTVYGYDNSYALLYIVLDKPFDPYNTSRMLIVNPTDIIYGSVKLTNKLNYKDYLVSDEEVSFRGDIPLNVKKFFVDRKILDNIPNKQCECGNLYDIIYEDIKINDVVEVVANGHLNINADIKTPAIIEGKVVDKKDLYTTYKLYIDVQGLFSKAYPFRVIEVDIRNLVIDDKYDKY